MHTRPLGNTGLSVGPIGFGAFKIGRNAKTKYPSAYDLPDEAGVARLLDGLIDLGICHFDTAPAYGLSEERIGNWLAQRSASVVISTKVGELFANGESRYVFDELSVRTSVANSLRLLRRDVLDMVLIHTPANDVEVLTETPVVETLRALQEAGDIRAIGLSGKTPEGAMLALDWADVLMVEFNTDDQSHGDVMQLAGQRGSGVLVKKGLASGHLPAEEAIPFVLNQAGVTSLVVGGLNLQHMAENLKIACRCGETNSR
ncbi:aldo/keto reductase [Blastopirellula marina]|uniref:Aldo/keto reductase n=1 Tax=Blastopirellula marina TaxID=124 RepID=A0A2S8FNF3_9BACT|nr:aldo/keto reductase [Blastopirellula marina]PQO33722.1 aldo/keto reductase [Blastopirellula marina]PTL43509.1 aldo/keto reductase [Blastopirellula marina]